MAAYLHYAHILPLDSAIWKLASYEKIATT